MRRFSSLLFAVAIASSLAAPPAHAQGVPARALQLTFDADGLVTLAAANVSVREILAEWARQCGCYIVNWDRLPGGPLPVPIAFEREPQRQVLEAILRSAAGYVLTPKRATAQSISNFETIYIVPSSTAVVGAYVPPSPAVQNFMPLPTPGSPEEEIPGVNGVLPPPVARPEPPGQNRPGMPTSPPGMTPANQPGRATGTPGVFVPIIPVAPSSPSNAPPPPSQVIPGMPTAPPPTIPPILPGGAR